MKAKRYQEGGDVPEGGRFAQSDRTSTDGRAMRLCERRSMSSLAKNRLVLPAVLPVVVPLRLLIRAMRLHG